jgi:hypothetical protein
VEEELSAKTSTVIRFLEGLAQYLHDPFVRADPMPPWLRFPERNWDPAWQAPSALLDPMRRIVPFGGERALKNRDDLVRWCLDPAPLAIRSTVARGGVGKTRLGVELCHRLRELRTTDGSPPWVAGFLVPDEFPVNGSPWDSMDLQELQLLIVIDYAGSPEKLPILKRLLPQLASVRARRMRLLLIDRQDHWLSELRLDQDCSELIGSPEFRRAFSAPDFTTDLDPAHRQRMFESAADAFRARLDPDASVRGEDDLSDPVFERVLLIHMLALLAIETHTTKLDEPGLLEAVIDRERRQWVKALASDKLDAALLPVVERVLWKFNVAGGCKTLQHAKKVASRIRTFNDLPNHIQERILSMLHTHYGDRTSFVAILQPDLLREYFIASPPRRSAAQSSR